MIGVLNRSGNDLRKPGTYYKEKQFLAPQKIITGVKLIDLFSTKTLIQGLLEFVWLNVN